MARSLNHDMRSQRPFAVTAIAWLFIAVSVLAFGAHFHESVAHWREGIWIGLTEFLGLLCGVFLLRGRNWARWLALAWLVFHVILSLYEPKELLFHALICAGIAWILFRPESAAYFRPASSQPG